MNMLFFRNARVIRRIHIYMTAQFGWNSPYRLPMPVSLPSNRLSRGGGTLSLLVGFVLHKRSVGRSCISLTTLAFVCHNVAISVRHLVSTALSLNVEYAIPSRDINQT
jgi:hypothetical protein